MLPPGGIFITGSDFLIDCVSIGAVGEITTRMEPAHWSESRAELTPLQERAFARLTKSRAYATKPVLSGGVRHSGE